MMKPHKISLIHAIALVALGSFGAMSSESMTAWIPTVFGVLLLACNRGVKNENKVLAHVAVLLTLLIVIGLVKPLQGALGREDMAAAARVATMLGLSVVALATFVKSFMDARKKKG
jgi:hypothetical protein